MAIRLGDAAPNFKMMTTEGYMDFHVWKNSSWCILFSHPADFTPVCTTELGMVAKMKDQFDQRNTKVVALSVDSVDDHKKWVEDINETQGTQINFPIIADPDRTISRLYGMIHPKADETHTVRSVFVIDPSNRVRLTLTYPASTGRNFDEILRVIDSLQLTEHEKVATPANWKYGENVMIIPSLSDEEAKRKFANFESIRPYMRITPQPEIRRH